MPSTTRSEHRNHVDSGLGRIRISNHATQRLLERIPIAAAWDHATAHRRISAAIHAGHGYGATVGNERLISFEIEAREGTIVTDTATLVAVLKPTYGGHIVITFLTPEQAAANQEMVFKRVDMDREATNKGLRAVLARISAERRGVAAGTPARKTWPTDADIPRPHDGPDAVRLAMELRDSLPLVPTRSAKNIWQGWHGKQDGVDVTQAIVDCVMAATPQALSENGMCLLCSGAFGTARAFLTPRYDRKGLNASIALAVP